MELSGNESEIENLSSTYTSSKNDFVNDIRIFVPVTFATILIVGVFGNILVIASIATNQEMRNSTFMFIGNLAVADLLFLLFCVPCHAVNYALTYWPFPYLWCSIVEYLQNVALFVAVWTLVAIALDRYLAIVFPVASIQFRTARNSCLCIFVLWSIVFLGNTPILRMYKVLEYVGKDHKKLTACVFVDFATASATKRYISTFCALWITFVFAAPLIITSILYLCVLRRLWNKLLNSRISISNEDHFEATRKVTLLVAAVTITFALCWLPIHLCYIFRAVTYEQHHSTQFRKSYLIVEIVAKILAFSNSCANPLLYAFFSSKFRKGFCQLWQHFNGRKRTNRQLLSYYQRKKTAA